MPKLTKNQVKSSLLEGRKVVANNWEISINDRDEVVIFPPKGDGFSTTLANLDRAVGDYCKKANTKKPGDRKKSETKVGPDSETQDLIKTPSIKKSPSRSPMKVDMNPGSEDDHPYTPKPTNKSPEAVPAPGGGGMPSMDLGPDSEGNTKWGGRPRIRDTFMDDSAPTEFYRELKAKKPSAELLRDITNEKKWVANTHVAVTPEGWEKTVKKMKDNPDIDNPWALTNWMENEGYEPGGKKKSLKTKKAGPPGKFEGVPDEYLELAEFLYDEGMADDDASVEGEGWYGLFLEEGVILFEDDRGFIDITVYNSPEEAQDEFDRISSEISEEWGEGVGQLEGYWFIDSSEGNIYIFGDRELEVAKNIAFSHGVDPSSVKKSEMSEIREEANQNGYSVEVDIQEGFRGDYDNTHIYDYFEKSSYRRSKKSLKTKKAGPKLREKWDDSGSYHRDIEAESPEDLHALTRALGGEEVDWSGFRQSPVEAEESMDDVVAKRGASDCMKESESDMEAVDEKAKDYYDKYFEQVDSDYGKQLTKDDVTDKRKRDRGKGKKSQAAPMPSQKQPVTPQAAPVSPGVPAAAPAAPAPGGAPPTPGGQKPAAPGAEMKPGTGDAGLQALGWTPEDIQLLDEEDKQKILQVQLSKPGTKAPKAPGVPPKGAPLAVPSGQPAPVAPATSAPQKQVPAPVARRMAQEILNKIQFKKVTRILTGQEVVPTMEPVAPPPAAPNQGAMPEFQQPGEEAIEGATTEQKAFQILSEVQQMPVQATTPESVPPMKAQELSKRLLTELGMPVEEAKQLFGVSKSGQGLISLFQ